MHRPLAWSDRRLLHSAAPGTRARKPSAQRPTAASMFDFRAVATRNTPPYGFNSIAQRHREGGPIVSERVLSWCVMKEQQQQPRLAVCSRLLCELANPKLYLAGI